MTALSLGDRARLQLDPRSAAPIYRQIYDRVRGAILDGTLPPGTRLPSWNALASELGVARGTVKAAYEWLAGEGYIVGEGAAGTRVKEGLGRDALAETARRKAAAAAAKQRVDDHTGLVPWGRMALPFHPGLPALDLFPRSVWSRLVARNARRLAPAAMGYQDPAGEMSLRAAIAHYLNVARGIVCGPEQIFITAGFTGALDVITRAVLQPGDQVWVEDPGYPRTREALRLAGAKLAPIAVDAGGLLVERGIAHAPKARLAVVTASHQAPLGMPLALPRRLALLDWARRSGGWILEDDYYGEFQIRGRLVPALKSLDEDERVVYVGTFSKVLMPSLRLGYIVAPKALVAALTRIVGLLAPSQSLLAQLSVADFMAEGHFARHLRRMRRLYRERGASLGAALTAAFGPAWTIERQEGGMYLRARLPRGVDDVELAARANAAGLGPSALSPWAIKARAGPGLILGFANVPAAEAEREVGRLARALRSRP